MSAKSSSGEWASGWPLVLSCAVGVSGPSVALYSLGQFMAPLEQEFGWTRTEVSIGMSVSLIIGILMSPIIGRVVDLMNARILALIGCVLAGLGTAALSLANGDTNFWIVLWLIKAASTVLIGPMTWVSVIPVVFARHRSMAMALALAGQSLALTFAPALSRYLIDAYGWRLAYDLLAIIWYGTTFALALFFFFDKRDHKTRPIPATAQSGKPREASAWVVFQSPTFLKLAFVVFAVKAATVGDMVHLAPAFVDKGFSAVQAAKVAGAAGVASVFGKVCIAWLFDRMSTFKVSAIIMAVFASASLMLVMLNAQLGWALATCAALGASDGAMLTAIACLCGRLFRPQEFGLVFGAMCSAMAISTAVGPTLASMAHDRFGSYTVVYWVGIAVASVCLLLLKTVDAPPPRLEQPAPSA